MNRWLAIVLCAWLTACSSNKPQPKLPPNPPGIASRLKSATVLVPPTQRRYQLIWEYDRPDTIFSIYVSSDLKTWNQLGDTLDHVFPLQTFTPEAFYIVGVQ